MRLIKIIKALWPVSGIFTQCDHSQVSRCQVTGSAGGSTQRGLWDIVPRCMGLRISLGCRGNGRVRRLVHAIGANLMVKTLKNLKILG